MMRRRPCRSPQEEDVMAVERAHEHPIFDSMGNTVTSLAAPARGATDAGLFRTEVPPGGGLP